MWHLGQCPYTRCSVSEKKTQSASSHNELIFYDPIKNDAISYFATKTDLAMEFIKKSTQKNERASGFQHI